jgi:hypothetical protein
MRLPLTESNSPESLWSPSGFAFGSPEWDGQTVNLADIYPPPNVVYPMAQPLPESGSYQGSHTDSHVDDGHRVAEAKTMNDKYIVSASTSLCQCGDPNCRASTAEQYELDAQTARPPTLSSGENGYRPVAPKGGSALKRKGSSDVS